jgi:hypothetical protein
MEYLTQAEIAERLNVDKRAVGRWMKRTDFPRFRWGVRAGRRRKEYSYDEVLSFCIRNDLPKKD